MYRITFAYNKLRGRPNMLRYPCAKSADNTTNPGYEVGYPVALTTYTGYTTASMPVLKVLDAADIAAAYTLDNSSGGIGGILGFAMEAAQTDSVGVARIRPVASTKAASAEPMFNAPTVATTLPVETTNLYSKLGVWHADDQNVFWGKLATGHTASSAVLGPADLALSGTNGYFTIDPAGTTSCLEIIGWDPSDTTRVLFTVVPAYQQLATGNIYTV